MDSAEHDPGFNPLAAAKALREAGFESRQAEVIAGVVSDGQRGPATKTDLDNLEVRLEAKIDAKIERAINQITWRMVALAGAVIAIVKFL